MKSLLARASSVSKKDMMSEANGNGTAAAPESQSKSAIPETLSPQRAAKKQEQEQEKLYAVTTHEEVPPRAVPSVRYNRCWYWRGGVCVRGGKECVYV